MELLGSDKPQFDVQMMKNIISLVSMAKVFPTALTLIVLAILEVLVESQVGKVIGHFYQICVDKDKEQLTVMLRNAALLYAVIVIIINLGYGTGQLLAIKWRGRLVSEMHNRYFQSNTFCHLQSVPSKPTIHPDLDSFRFGAGGGVPVTAVAVPGAATAEHDLLLSGGRAARSSRGLQHGRLDNPDQRMTQDVVQFCEKLEQFIRKTAKSPFNLIVYVYLTVRLFQSVTPVLCAVAYFLLFALLQKTVMSTMTTAINTYQQCEGDLRAAHMRVRVDAVPIASWGGSAVEERNVNQALHLTLSAQASMAWTFIMQQTLAKTGDYYATMVNYAIIGLAVFSGSFTQGPQTQGATASEVSQASFYLIMLMNSLTTILDATKFLGEVAGHTSRICNFIQQMDSITPAKGHSAQSRKPSPFSPRTHPRVEDARREAQAMQASPTLVVDFDPGGQGRSFRRVLSDTFNRRRPAAEELDVWSSNEALTTAFGGSLPEYLKQQASTLLPPTNGVLAEGGMMEVSVHRLGTDELGEIVGNVFPDVPLGSPLLAVCTFQAVPSLGSVVLRPAQAREKQMAALLKRYLSWEGSVRANLQAHGFWCDSVHPQTGYALYSTRGAKYSEAIGAQVFLEYQARNEGGCGVIVHPTYGYKVYPVTFFTTAPYVSLLAAMTKVCKLDGDDQPTQWHYNTTDRSDLPLVSVFDVTIADSSTADGVSGFSRCSARNVSFEVQNSQHVVIQGNPGIGKSTMLSAIRGLTKIHQGGIKWRPGVQAMFVPQLSVVAPDATLSAQVSYPSLELCSHEDAVHALTTVGLEYIVERFEKGATLEDFMTLSKGELQCVGIARLLRAKPDLAMLDEAMSAVPAKTELRLLNILAQAGITLLMVSHREEVHQFASSVLTFDTSLTDGWKLEHFH